MNPYICCGLDYLRPLGLLKTTCSTHGPLPTAGGRLHSSTKLEQCIHILFGVPCQYKNTPMFIKHNGFLQGVKSFVPFWIIEVNPKANRTTGLLSSHLHLLLAAQAQAENEALRAQTPQHAEEVEVRGRR